MFSACVAAVKSRPVLHHCVVIFSGPQGSWSVHVCCLHLKMEFRSCARGRQVCGIIHYYWWTASIKPRLLFSRTGYASWGLSLSSVKYLERDCIWPMYMLDTFCIKSLIMVKHTRLNVFSWITLLKDAKYTVW